MKIKLVIISLFLAFSLILSACTNGAPTQDPAQAAATMAAQVEALVATRLAKVMTDLEATQNAKPTSTPFIPTVGPLPTTATVNLPTLSLPGVATSVGCNPPPLPLGENYPDGTSITVNTSFNKSWAIQNAGTCTWNANYKIKFVSGDAMSGPSFKPFGVSVPPGGSITLTLPLKAPGAPGTTTGYWGLYDDKDAYFGRVWVTINSTAVAPTSSSFSVTSITTSVNNAVPGACPFTFIFTAAITSNRDGDVTYHWIRSDSATSAPETLTYTAAGTKSVTYSWDLGAAGPHWVKVYIDSPNHQEFAQANITCP